MNVEDQIEAHIIEAHKVLKIQFDSLSKRFETIKDKKKEQTDKKMDINEKTDEIQYNSIIIKDFDNNEKHLGEKLNLPKDEIDWYNYKLRTDEKKGS